MTWWVYKSNSRNDPHQSAYGDWEDVFEQSRAMSWGRTSWVPSLAKLRKGDQLLAYQTNRNELVGIAEVTALLKDGDDKVLYVRPVLTIGTKVRPLKKANRRVASIRALQPGPIQTLYDISERDALLLLTAAGVRRARALRHRETPAREVDQERRFIEGERRSGLTSVRNPILRREAKKFWGADCYCCGFNFEASYGTIAQNVAIVHHLKVFEGHNRREATVQDVRVLCANCHYVVHLRHPPIPVVALRRSIKARRGN